MAETKNIGKHKKTIDKVIEKIFKYKHPELRKKYLDYCLLDIYNYQHKDYYGKDTSFYQNLTEMRDGNISISIFQVNLYNDLCENVSTRIMIKNCYFDDKVNYTNNGIYRVFYEKVLEFTRGMYNSIENMEKLDKIIKSVTKIKEEISGKPYFGGYNDYFGKVSGYFIKSDNMGCGCLSREILKNIDSEVSTCGRNKNRQAHISIRIVFMKNGVQKFFNLLTDLRTNYCLDNLTKLQDFLINHDPKYNEFKKIALDCITL